jgi:hypothetical protein
VLVNVPEPEQILKEMVALTRPGGVVASWEADWVSWLCYPEHPAWARIMEAMQTVSLQDGQNCFIGRRLVGLMRTAGLEEVKQEVAVDEWPALLEVRQVLVRYAVG